MTGPAGWMAALEALRRSQLFDEAWYLAHYPDVAASGVEPALHYVKYGMRLGRDPGPGAAPHGWDDAASALPAGASIRGHRLAAVRAGLGPRQAARDTSARAEGEPGRTAEAQRMAGVALPPELIQAAAIGKVNLAARAGDRQAWVLALGKYLACQNTTLLGVSEAPDNVLAALAFQPPPRVEAGPLVSVIMPAWNAQDSVAYAVRSILAQTWRPLELIVVDDASTDATPAILRELAASDPRMIVLRNDVNAGPYASKNVGLMAARGFYVTGHDSDDLALPDRIERQVRFLRMRGGRSGLISMLRMTARGEVTRLDLAGANAVDGVSQTAMISLMMETRQLRGLYGHWDTIRFGADAELARRVAAVEGREIPRLHEVGIFLLDRPESLTNHPEHGYVPGRIAPSRLTYRKAAHLWHRRLGARSAYLPFPHEPRRFPAQPEVLNAPGVVDQVIAGHRRSHPTLLDRPIECDVCIVTTLHFPGGNCSSTLDEVRFLATRGCDVRLVHCTIDARLGPRQAFLHNERYEPWAGRILDWPDVGRLRCRHLIVRHPSVITSVAFARLMERVECGSAHLVINNGTHLETGERVYDPAAVVEAARRVRAREVRIVPISPLIRRQIEGQVPPDLLSPRDWSPTFDVADYAHPAKDVLTTPFVVGRHGRDAFEKWIEDPAALRAAYPASDDFAVSILGGADRAAELLGGLPANWRVAEFGTVAPKAFLQGLDVFVYFPHSRRHEAFGRTVVEAMIASRPVLLPPRFETTFGELGLYGQPWAVEPMVRSLAADWAATRAWLAAVQGAAIARYASEAIAARLTDLGLQAPDGDARPLPADLVAFKRRIEAAGAGTTTHPTRRGLGEWWSRWRR